MGMGLPVLPALQSHPPHSHFRLNKATLKTVKYKVKFQMVYLYPWKHTLVYDRQTI
jgi:hypothetical protein